MPMAPLNREEHLKWCKGRALAYLDQYRLQDACASMVGDLAEHPETKNANPYLLSLGILLATNGDYEGMRRWIEGFR